MGDVSVEDIVVTDELEVALGVFVNINIGVVCVEDTVFRDMLGVEVVLRVAVKIDTGVVCVEEAGDVTGSEVD